MNPAPPNAAAAPEPALADWSAAARPTLFTASARPQLITVILLAHLASPRLWALAARAVKTAGPDFAARISAIYHFVNRKFLHASKQTFGRLWGLQDRDLLTDPVERAESDYAMSALLQCMPQSISDAPTVALMMNVLCQGQCPQYVYPAIEVIQALPAVCPGAARRTLGITSCLDECILMAALAVAAGVCRFADLVFIGSLFHYSVFILTDGGAWLNGKRGMFDGATWRAATAGLAAADIQALFDRQLVLCDRLITPGGWCRLPDGPVTLAAPRWTALAEKLGRFVGTELRQVRRALECAAAAAHPADAAPLLAQLDGCGSAEEFAARLETLTRATGHPLLEAVRYARRAPDVRQPEAYLLAAGRGFRVLMRSAQVLVPADAVALAREIKGEVSVFGQTGRLALPDESMLLGVASPSERALLLHSLLRLSPTLAAEAVHAARLEGRPDNWRLTWHGRPLAD